MEITTTYHGTRRMSILIEIDNGDDPFGHIGNLVQGGLSALLKACGDVDRFHPGQMSNDEFTAVLGAMNDVTNRVNEDHELLILIARDMRGMSWRQIEAVTGVPVATIRRRVRAARLAFALTDTA